MSSDDPLNIPSLGETWQKHAAEAKANQQMVLAILRALHALAQFVLFAASLTVEVFLRYDFGERYLKPPAVLLGLAWLALASLYFGPQAVGAETLTTFAHAFIVVSLLKMVWIQIRIRRGVRWHSKSPGVPLPPLARIATSHSMLHQIIEPAIAIVAGVVVIVSGGGVLGLYLFFAAIAMVGKNLIERARFREKLLDAIDSQIESETFAEAMKDRPSPRKARGFVVPGAGKWLSSPKVSSLSDPYPTAR